MFSIKVGVLDVQLVATDLEFLDIGDGKTRALPALPVQLDCQCCNLNSDFGYEYHGTAGMTESVATLNIANEQGILDKLDDCCN